MTRKRIIAAVVEPAAEGRATHLPAKLARDIALPVVIPDSLGMLKDLKVIMQGDIDVMLNKQKGGGEADATGQKIRNLVASIGGIVAAEKAAVDDTALAKLTKRELAAKLREEATKLDDDSDDGDLSDD